MEEADRKKLDQEIVSFINGEITLSVLLTGILGRDIQFVNEDKNIAE